MRSAVSDNTDMDTQKYTERMLKRFWSRVDKSQGEENCWLWSGTKDKDGYGVFYHRKRDNNVRAHRVAWELYHGTIDDDLLVLHTCDTPPCCNPKHLFQGTTLDNVNDKMQKGRWNGQQRKRVQKQCLVCGTTYDIKQSSADTSRYCSRECKSKGLWLFGNMRNRKQPKRIRE